MKIKLHPLGFKTNAAQLLVGCFFYLWLVACPALGQAVTKGAIKPEHYKLWSVLSLKGICPTGMFVSFALSYPEGRDTLFVMSVDGKKKYAFAQCRIGKFGPDNLFASTTEKGTELVNLASANRIALPDAQACQFIGSGKILLNEKQGTAMRLRIIDTMGKSLKTVDSISAYVLSGDSQKVAFFRIGKKCAIGILTLDSFRVDWITSGQNMLYREMAWAPNDNALVYCTAQGDSGFSVLGLYTFETGKTYVLKPESKTKIVKDSRFPLAVSNDLKKVFFAHEPTKAPEIESPNVQIWHSGDRQTYIQNRNESESRNIKMAVWYPDGGNWHGLMTENENMLLLAGNQRFALTANRLRHEPQWDYEAPIDFSITDLENGIKKPFLEKQSPTLHHLLPSPAGKYILYFRDRQWNAYHLETKTVKCLTENLGVAFDDELHDTMQERQAYGVAGWSHKDGTVLLYDRYDLWEANPHTGKAQRLTFGREKGICYRVLKEDGQSNIPNYSGWTSPVLTLENGLLLSARGDDKNSGFSIWSPQNGLKTLTYGPDHCEPIKCAGETCVYQSQNFGLPPRLNILTGKKTGLLFQSNPQHKRFAWGRAEPFHYTGIDGRRLDGYICFPAGYKKGKLYPMVVHIYEQQYRDLHMYRSPSETNPNGFNPTQYVQDGYLVLFPDLSFRMGGPGISAAKNLELAIGQVLQLGIADPKRIGLIGHSFGGYLTNFVVSQTDVFAAAVSGSGISDSESNYFSINWDTGKANLWRYEYQQFRMGQSIFEDWEAYERNNPIRYAQNIKTPLLTWTGNQDYQVDWQQSTKLYMALRRLGKQHVMLVYPSEWHILMRKENQIDLSRKIKAWFDYYLKGEPAEKWILEPQN